MRGMGKISHINDPAPTRTNAEGIAAITRLWSESERGLLFASLVDFDMLFGHRRDPIGHARALAEFDAWLPSFLKKVTPADLVIITADHGNDPTWPGTDYIREEVPLIVGQGERADSLGMCETFADVAATLATFFQLAPPWQIGKSFV